MTKSGVISFVKRQRYVCVMTLVVAFAGTAGAQLMVNAPNNNSVVNSTFYLQAAAPSCESHPTTSMAYSIDSGNDVVFSGAQSLQTMVTIPVNGVHTLDVKASSGTGEVCERNVLLTVGNGVTVSAPALGAIVTSPFTLQTQAPTCDGQSTQSMAYELDSIWDPHGNHGLGPNHNHRSTVLNASVSASTGSYLLRVKAKGDSGAYCETDINLDVAASSGLVPPAEASQYAHMENDPTYTGSYAPCGGANGPSANLWLTEPDCATSGTKSGSTSIVSTPMYGGQPDSREFTMTSNTSGGGVRWYDKAINGEFPVTHLQYDVYVNFVDSSSVGNLELDINHVITSPANTLYQPSTQCNLTKGLWQVTVKGAPGSWVNTNATCTRSQIASGVWHHIQVQVHHDANGGTGIYYDAVAIDGHVTPITTCTIASGASAGQPIPCQSTPTHPGWGAQIGPQFQIDGNGTITAYVDDFTVFYW